MDWLEFALAAAAVGGLFWAASRLIARTQAGDPSHRGRDAAEPGGFYSDTGPGPD